jgi:hypothetical protein
VSDGHGGGSGAMVNVRVNGVNDAVIGAMQKVFYTGPFAVVGNRSVGAVVVSDLRAMMGSFCDPLPLSWNSRSPMMSDISGLRTRRSIPSREI